MTMLVNFFLALTIIVLIELLIGLVKPRWAVYWRPVERRIRWSVMKVWGSSLLFLLIILITLFTRWPIFFILIGAIFALASLFTILIGLIKPSKVRCIGKTTRWKIVWQYTLLFIVLFFIAGLPASIKYEQDEMAMGIYEGDKKDGLKDGNGKISNYSGFYNGEWKNNLRNGTGKEVTNFGFLAKIVYNGEWKDNQEEGYGEQTVQLFWIDVHYEGEWKNGLRHGEGTFIDRDGNVYKGQWKNDAPNGKGTFTLANGETYVGEVKDWERHGQGKAVDPDGKVLEGNWVEDELEE
jgi:hypothetical protein